MARNFFRELPIIVVEGNMSVAQQDKKDDQDVAAPAQAAEAAQQKQEANQAPKESDATDSAPAGAQTEAETGKAKVQPRIRIANPASGAAYPKHTKLPIEIECEGEGEFEASLVLRDQHGHARFEDVIKITLGEEHRGNATVLLDLQQLLGETTDPSGTYQLHAFGTDASGQPAPMSRINIDIIDEERAETPNMPHDVANAPPDDSDRANS
jgi:hypothetical protein